MVPWWRSGSGAGPGLFVFLFFLFLFASDLEAVIHRPIVGHLALDAPKKTSKTYAKTIQKDIKGHQNLSRIIKHHHINYKNLLRKLYTNIKNHDMLKSESPHGFAFHPDSGGVVSLPG